jgi:hypothetical protein
MAESAALLVDEVLPGQPLRQWVLSVPFTSVRIRWVKAPTSQELTQRVHTLAHRVGRFKDGFF